MIDPKLIARFEAAGGVVPPCGCGVFSSLQEALRQTHEVWDSLGPDGSPFVHLIEDVQCTCKGTGRDTSPAALSMAADLWVLARGGFVRVSVAYVRLSAALPAITSGMFEAKAEHDQTPVGITSAKLELTARWHDSAREHL